MLTAWRLYSQLSILQTRAETKVDEQKSTCLSGSVKAEIDELLKMFPTSHRQSALIGALHAAQEHNHGFLTPALIEGVAAYINVPAIRAQEVASFYSMLETKPVARNNISVCTNLSCMLCGSDEILAHIEKRLGIKVGESTPDNKFYLKREEECLAACVGAPMMMLNHKYYENLTIESVDEILDGVQ